MPTAAAISVLSIDFVIVYAQEFQSAHVHNNLSNLQKADGVAAMMGQLVGRALAQLILQVAAQLSQLTLSAF